MSECSDRAGEPPPLCPLEEGDRLHPHDESDEEGDRDEEHKHSKAPIDESLLISKCSVCCGPAAAHLHYGAISCYSCRAFFRRGHPKQVRCIFGHGQCKISRHNRTNCKLCRYNRCLEAGMKADKVDAYLNKRKEREARLSEAQKTGSEEMLLGDIQPNRSPASEAFVRNAEGKKIDPVTGKPIKRKYTRRKPLEKKGTANKETKEGNVKETGPSMKTSNPDNEAFSSPKLVASGSDRPSNVSWHMPTNGSDVKKEDYSPHSSSSEGFSPQNSYKQQRLTGQQYPGFFPAGQPDHLFHHALWQKERQFKSSYMCNDGPMSPSKMFHRTQSDNVMIPRSRNENIVSPGSKMVSSVNQDVQNGHSGTQMTRDYQFTNERLRDGPIFHQGPRNDTRFGPGVPNDRSFSGGIESDYTRGPYAWRDHSMRVNQNSHHEYNEKNRFKGDSQQSPRMRSDPFVMPGYEIDKGNSQSLKHDQFHRPRSSGDIPMSSVPWNNHTKSRIEPNHHEDQGVYFSDNVLQHHQVIRSNQTSVIMREKSDYRQESPPQPEIKDIKPEPQNFNLSLLQSFRTPVVSQHLGAGGQLLEEHMHNKTEIKEEGPPTPPADCLTPPGGIQMSGMMNMEEQKNIFRPYSSVIIRNNKGQSGPEDQDIGHFKHKIVDFREPNNIPAPDVNPRAILYQNYRPEQRNMADMLWHQEDNKDDLLENLIEDEDEAKDVEHIVNTEDLLYDDVPRIMLPKRKISSPCESYSGSEEELEELCRDSSTLVPLKKRARMFEVPYAIGHGINKNALPVMQFTYQEEFQVIEYVVAIEQYQNQRWDYMSREFPKYRQMMVGLVALTAKGQKIPFNKMIEKMLFNIGLEFTKHNCKHIYEEMGKLRTDVRGQALNTTYMALYIVMYSILEGNTGESTWMKQHMKTIHATKENHAALKDLIPGLEEVRPISLEDQERFTSPWACKQSDEDKFTRTVAVVGRLLKDDIQLQALYHMLVMMTPARPTTPKHIQEDPELQGIQVKLCQLIYRYLESGGNSKYTKPVSPPASPPNLSSPPSSPRQPSSIMGMAADLGELNADLKTRLLIGLIDDLHDCADIMQNRSLSSVS